MTPTQYEKLHSAIYIMLMSVATTNEDGETVDIMGMGEMGECSDTARDLIYDWAKDTSVEISETMTTDEMQELLETKYPTLNTYAYSDAIKILNASGVADERGYSLFNYWGTQTTDNYVNKVNKEFVELLERNGWWAEAENSEVLTIRIIK